MKSKITAKCAAVLMSALIGASSCAIPTFAATTANDNCINPSTISSIFNNDSQNSGSVLTRNPEDIKPMSLDYVINNMDNLITGIHDKYIVSGSSNIDVKRDVKIIDPRIVAVFVDDSKVDTSKIGDYPLKYTICFKPLLNDSSNQQKLVPSKNNQESRDGSSFYTYTDLAKHLQTNEYVALNLQSIVYVGVKSYANTVMSKPDWYYQHQGVKPSTYYYESNMQRFDSNPIKPVSQYFLNLNGSFVNKTASVTVPFTTQIGMGGAWCAKCGALFATHEWGYHVNDAIIAHEETSCKANWVTLPSVSHNVPAGSSLNFSIFQVQ